MIQIVMVIRKFWSKWKGNEIQEYLEKFQSEMSVGFQECDHKYSRNGTISCIKCGKTIHV